MGAQPPDPLLEAHTKGETPFNPMGVAPPHPQGALPLQPRWRAPQSSLRKIRGLSFGGFSDRGSANRSALCFICNASAWPRPPEFYGKHNGVLIVGWVSIYAARIIFLEVVLCSGGEL